LTNWTDNYKKLKVKLIGAKIAESKKIKYHYSDVDVDSVKAAS